MKWFYSPNRDVADDTMDGLIQYRKVALRRYARDTQKRIVVRSNLDKTKAYVIRGGGVDREPLQATSLGGNVQWCGVWHVNALQRLHQYA